MTPWQDVADDDDDDWGDDDDSPHDYLRATELPDPADTDDGGPDGEATDTVPCPFCGRPVYAAADLCPSCRSFIGGSDDPTPTRRWPRWFVVGLILCLVGTFVACATRMW